LLMPMFTCSCFSCKRWSHNCLQWWISQLAWVKLPTHYSSTWMKHSNHKMMDMGRTQWPWHNWHQDLCVCTHVPDFA
jgi:hypothetical protein